MRVVVYNDWHKLVVQRDLGEYRAEEARPYDSHPAARGKVEFIVYIFCQRNVFYAQREYIVHAVGQNGNVVVFAHRKIAQKAVEVLPRNERGGAFALVAALAGVAFSAGAHGVEIHARALVDPVAVFARGGNYAHGYAPYRLGVGYFCCARVSQTVESGYQNVGNAHLNLGCADLRFRLALLFKHFRTD